MDCGELLYGRRFPLELKLVVYEDYVWPAILYGCKAWRLKECEMGIMQILEISTLLVICEV